MSGVFGGAQIMIKNLVKIHYSMDAQVTLIILMDIILLDETWTSFFWESLSRFILSSHIQLMDGRY